VTATPAISIIVLTYNGRRWLEICLPALAAQQGSEAFEVLVVDNASSDGSVELVRGSWPEVSLVALDRNLGFAGGNNAGIRAARGRFITFLNNDTRPRPDWLAALRRALDDHPWAALATSRIVYMDRPDVIDSAGDGYLRCGGAFKHHHGQPVSGAVESREVFGACGAACMIRRDVLDDVGGFDEDFYIFYEDVDLSYRARLRGHRCVYAADAIVEHAGSATMGRVSPAAVFYGQRNLEWTWIKNSPWPLLVRSLPSHVAYGVAAGVTYALHGHSWPFIRAKVAALTGLIRVLRQRREIQRRRTASVSDLWNGMEPGWFRLKRREKRFDLSGTRNEG
jgi:GT2 family glycosyltransferase